VDSYKDSPLEDFVFKNLDIAARTAGTIRYAAEWRFSHIVIRSEDKSKIAVKDSTRVTGLE
jgi:hypothetical protein